VKPSYPHLHDLTVATIHTYYVVAEDAGNMRQPGDEAHHIVPENHPRSAPARAVLDQFGIEIDSAENGVFLPGTRSVANGRPGNIAVPQATSTVMV
jgi:hypothetical protein